MEQNVSQINGGITINEYKKYHISEKDHIWNPSTCDCENGKYLTIIMNDSTIICDEVTDSYDEEIKTIQTNFNKKKVTCKLQRFYIFTCIFINYYSIIDSYSVDSIYCYLIKYRAKKIFPFHDAKLKQFSIDTIKLK